MISYMKKMKLDYKREHKGSHGVYNTRGDQDGRGSTGEKRVVGANG